MHQSSRQKVKPAAILTKCTEFRSTEKVHQILTMTVIEPCSAGAVLHRVYVIEQESPLYTQGSPKAMVTNDQSRSIHSSIILRPCPPLERTK